MSKGTFSALVAVVCALSGSVAAQDVAAQETGAVETSAAAPVTSAAVHSAISPGKLRILVGLHFGGGGQLKSDVEGPGGVSRTDLSAIVGIQAGAEYVLMKYLALGGEFRIGFWNTKDASDADIGRSRFFDIDIKPRGRYVFDRFPIEIYGTVPLGLTVASINSDNADVEGKVGFNFGIGAGANYFFTDMFGVNLEAGGIWHWFGTTYEGGFNKVDVSNRAAQFYMFVNGVIAL